MLSICLYMFMIDHPTSNSPNIGISAGNPHLWPGPRPHRQVMPFLLRGVLRHIPPAVNSLLVPQNHRNHSFFLPGKKHLKLKYVVNIDFFPVYVPNDVPKRQFARWVSIHVASEGTQSCSFLDVWLIFVLLHLQPTTCCS